MFTDGAELKKEYNPEEEIENKTTDVKKKYLEIASVLEDKIITELTKGNILAMKDLDTLNSMINIILGF